MALKTTLQARFLRPLHPRDPHEHHRVSTPLELLFDLVTVIAIASAAAGLHHAVAAGHAAGGIITFLMAFFAIWWAWMNFTWFASAYDNDDPAYRLLIMLLMAGALVIAAGIPNVIGDFPNFTLVIFGYSIMRVGMITLWLRAAAHDIARRRTALAYAAGIFLTQIYWITLLAIQPIGENLGYGLFLVGVVLELLVPAVAEPLSSNTPWHRHHIVERYGLLNLIVLGETLLSGSTALRDIATGFNATLALTALFSLVIVFSLWWSYFGDERHLNRPGLRHTLLWGYGHFLIFASGAATGAGFGVVVDVTTKASHLPQFLAEASVAIPVALYLAALWFVRDRVAAHGPGRFALPASSLLTVSITAIGMDLCPALGCIAASTALGVILRNVLISTPDSGSATIH
ncbi:low temperature requirement protein A [Rhizobium oryzicola]|uniref:Low temperature requirement protein A n=1 Tax=Rhizobium oryzicola TaxID=1232668 RepID=A0ABT8SW54_9HYPH|nr:low temperature requirement protein A [Rhizobium oryzicola]MDO1582113.1 low temperature requirement protein A [Rhizobium oryzicola]